MRKFFIFISLFVFFVFNSCESNTNENDDENVSDTSNNDDINVKTGSVTFFNESGYRVIVHQDAFSGPVLIELGGGESKKVDVRTSDNHGIGTVFSIEYLFQITQGFDIDSGTVIASFIDPNVQINRVIEEGKSYTIQIPHPANPEPRSAFIRIINSHNLQFELSYMGTVFKQTGNGNVPVPSLKTGVYKLEGIPADGKIIQNYSVITTFSSIIIPDFSVKNGFIYNFIYNGSSVIKNCSCEPCICEDCTCSGYVQPFIIN